VALAPLVVAGWVRWLRAKQVRGHLRRAFRSANPADRELAIDAAFAVAGDSALRVVGLTEEAARLGLLPAARRGAERAAALGAHPNDLVRLRGMLASERPKARHAVEDVVAVERFLEEGLVERARERLGAALARYPDDADLLALRERVPPT
jgi:hypothetical protein